MRPTAPVNHHAHHRPLPNRRARIPSPWRRVAIVAAGLCVFPAQTLALVIVFCALASREARALWLLAGVAAVFMLLPLWVFVLYLAHVVMEVCAPRVLDGIVHTHRD